jgi:Protein of unknown function (DUF2510)
VKGPSPISPQRFLLVISQIDHGWSSVSCQTLDIGVSPPRTPSANPLAGGVPWMVPRRWLSLQSKGPAAMGAYSPPGWYPDPVGTGMQRYWDGIAWTDVKVAPAPPPTAGLPKKQKW